MDAQRPIYPQRVRKKSVGQFHGGPRTSIHRFGIENSSLSNTAVAVTDEEIDVCDGASTRTLAIVNTDNRIMANAAGEIRGNFQEMDHPHAEGFHQGAIHADLQVPRN